VVFNDDFGGSLRSGVHFVAPSTGDFRVRVRPYNCAPGAGTCSGECSYIITAHKHVATESDFPSYP
jgi:hypothetical protein